MLINNKITRMSLEEFENLVLGLDITLYQKEGYNGFYMRRDKPVKDCWIIKRWTIGGLSGGSCWGTERYAITADPEPEFIDLDEILAEVAPEISYLEYKKLLRKVDACDTTTTDHDYYGNHTDDAIKAINIKNLYDSLAELCQAAGADSDVI